MLGDDTLQGRFFWHGPRLWAASAVLGVLAGVGLAFAAPATFDDAGQAVVPLWLAAPFAIMLLSIALGPLISPRQWHRHFPDVAFLLGGLVVGYYLAAYRQPGHGPLTYGQEKLLHAGVEYYAFIALVGGLYIVCGTILIRVRDRAGPLANTLLLLLGAILANVLGTTGASMLLIRPFMRLNEGRLRPLHVVFFIFIVSNCGGCLTPIGDPPLYLGFLKGVPFFWTATSLWPDWLVTVGALLAVYFVYDTALERRRRLELGPDYRPGSALPGIALAARPHSLSLLVGMIGAVFVDPLLSLAGIDGIPVGATIQIVLAVIAYLTADRETLKSNDFSFFPVKEVGLLFIGIFFTMIPALGYLAAHGQDLGLRSATAYYFGTGALSAVLDNAPTYLNFLQVALTPEDLNRAAIYTMLQSDQGPATLRAISTGAVFFGAMTYIGNGPNFMVRTIAESSTVRMPSFFGYFLWALAILLPVLILHWALMIR